MREEGSGQGPPGSPDLSLSQTGSLWELWGPGGEEGPPGLAAGGPPPALPLSIFMRVLHVGQLGGWRRTSRKGKTMWAGSQDPKHAVVQMGRVGSAQRAGREQHQPCPLPILGEGQEAPPPGLPRP